MSTLLNNIEKLVADAAAAAADSAAKPVVASVATPHTSADAAPVVAQAPPSNVVQLPGLPPVLGPFVAEAGDELHSFMTADLAKSGLSVADLPAWVAVRSEGVARYTRMQSTPSGYAIPYMDLAGKPVQDNGQPFVRFRLQSPLNQVIADDGSIKGKGKYISAKDSAWHVYVPSGLRGIFDGYGDDLPLIVVEGEKKSEALVKLGFPAVAIAGVHLWFDPEADRRDALETRPVHPELMDLIKEYGEWVDGQPTVMVLFDSDGVEVAKTSATVGLPEIRVGKRMIRVRNADVFHAGRTAAAALYRDLGMSMHTVAAYCPEGVGGAKLGADDWIVAAGGDAVREAIVQLAQRPTHRRLNANGLAPHVLVNNESQDLDALLGHFAKHEDLYVFGGRPALIEPDAEDVRLIESADNLAVEISKCVQVFERGAEGKLREAYIPTKLVTALYKKDWAPLHDLRHVEAVSAQPVPMLRDGVPYITKSGYDEATGIYGNFDGAEWDIPAKPTFAQFVGATHILGELLDDVYFQSVEDVSAMIAALLTAVARPGLETAPGFLLSAPGSGAGKGYLATVIGKIATDLRAHADVMTLNTSGGNAETEFSKMILGALATRRPVLQFDEVEGNRIDGKNLRTLLTSPMFSGRRLGTHDIIALPTRKMILVTASNIDPTMDSARRFITVRINPPADPAQRNQSADNGAVEKLRKDRIKYARAAVIVSLGGMHMLADQPNKMPMGIGLLGTFEDWSRVVAGPALLAAWLLLKREAEPMNLVERDGIESIVERNPLREQVEELSPMLRQKQTIDTDPARMAVRDLLEALHRFQAEKLDSKPFTAGQLVDELREQRHLAEKYQRDYGTDVRPEQFAVYQELSASGLRNDQMSSTTKLGNELKRYRDVAVGGYMLKAGKDRTNKSTWNVVKIG